ncbi:hypothetical protein ScPMuIL_010641 [Solemya velum]
MTWNNILGIRFSFRHQFKDDPTKCSGRIWKANIGSFKTPTCILLKPDKSFAAFGYDAEDKYSQLASDDEHRNWYYIKTFKMRLHDETDDMLKLCHDQATNIEEKDIGWVITTPAIWSNAAKQFMREAAIKAGIDNASLTIALEPEAASIYCRHAKLHAYQDAQLLTSVAQLTPLTRYAILDAGGGTVDITVHEVNKDGTLKEIYQANGGPWGGTMVDDEFKKFFSRIVGGSVWHTFQNEFMDDYLELVREFEVKKREISPDSENKMMFRVPLL